MKIISMKISKTFPIQLFCTYIFLAVVVVPHLSPAQEMAKQDLPFRGAVLTQ